MEPDPYMSAVFLTCKDASYKDAPMTFVPSSILVSRNPNLVAANVDGDLVMMSVEQGEYFGITGVGSRVWELLATPT